MERRGVAKRRVFSFYLILNGGETDGAPSTLRNDDRVNDDAEIALVSFAVRELRLNDELPNDFVVFRFERRRDAERKRRRKFLRLFRVGRNVDVVLRKERSRKDFATIANRVRSLQVTGDLFATDENGQAFRRDATAQKEAKPNFAPGQNRKFRNFERRRADDPFDAARSPKSAAKQETDAAKDRAENKRKRFVDRGFRRRNDVNEDATRR